jgi:hypothetical protein
MDPDRPDGRSSAGRVVLLTLGALLSVTALVLVLAGAALLIGLAYFDDDGFLTTSSQSIESDGYAIVSEPFEFDELEDWPFPESARLRATLDGEKELFVGVARAADVTAALDGIDHDVMRGAPRGGPFGDDVRLDRREGRALTGDPAELVEWEASARGRNDVTTTWEPRDGEWVLVAMNADASQGFDVEGSIGADVPYLSALTWGVLGLGLLLGLLAAVPIVLGGRSGHAIEPPSLPAVDSAMAVRLRVSIEEAPSRWLWLIKWLLLIPHFIALLFLSAAFVVVTIIAWFAIVFTGRYPRSLFDFNLGVLRWSWRVNGYGYGALATDRYPPFSLAQHAEYPATLDVDYPQRLHRGLPLVKWLLAMPHLLLIAAASGGVVIGTANADTVSEIGLIGVIVLIMGIALLFTGRLPRGLFDLLVGTQRWIYRTVAYLALMTDDYPPFRLDQGGEEPAGERATGRV